MRWVPPLMNKPHFSTPRLRAVLVSPGRLHLDSAWDEPTGIDGQQASQRRWQRISVVHCFRAWDFDVPLCFTSEKPRNIFATNLWMNLGHLWKIIAFMIQV